MHIIVHFYFIFYLQANPHLTYLDTPAQRSADLMGPVHIIAYILASILVVMIAACIIWELCHKKHDVSNKVVMIDTPGKAKYSIVNDLNICFLNSYGKYVVNMMNGNTFGQLK